MPKGRPLLHIPVYTVVLILLTLRPAWTAAPTVTWEQLQEEGAVIAGIDIEIQDVFPEEDPASRYWFASIANAVHIETKRHVVARELQFKVGDRVNAAVIRDSERSLQGILDVVRDVAIVPERVEGNRVWVRVILKDAWTLGISADYSHVGGQNRSRLMIHERNLLGLGKSIRIGRNQTFEKTSDEFTYYDPQLLGSRWRLNVGYRKFSEGDSRSLEIDRPFRTFHTPWAFSLNALDYDSPLTLYTLASPVYDLRHQVQSVDLMAAWAYRETSSGVYRIGAGFEDRKVRYSDVFTHRSDLLSPLETVDRHLRGLKVSWEWFDDGYQDFRNMQKIDRTEHYNLGWNVGAALGYYSPSLGSGTAGPFFNTTVSKGWRLNDDSLFLVNLSAHGRHENGAWRDMLLSSELFFYNQRFPMQTLAGYLGWDLGSRPDPENWCYLGALRGLRGYPNHFLAGDGRWLFSLEDRIITNHTIWGLVQLGFVGFLDMGAIHSFDGKERGKIYADAGLGFRLGNIRVRQDNVIQLVVAFPLVKGPGTAGYEIVLGNYIRF